MEKIMEIIAAGVLVIVMISGIAVLLALPVMLLWNWLMPDIFGTPTISFWQSLGLLLLAGFLFKNGSSSNKD